MSEPFEVDRQTELIRRQQLDEDDYDFRETKRCGGCGHFDTINQCCWVIASDGICRDVSDDSYCVFNFKEDS